MSNKTHSMTFRGELCGLDASGKTIAFITSHVEQKPSSLYLIDGESNKLSSIPLDFVAESLLRIDGQFWISGAGNSLHCVDEKSKKITAHKIPLESPVVAMAALADSRLGLITANKFCVVSIAKKAKVTQSFDLDSDGTSIAANPTGDWVAVGAKEGMIHVFCVDEESDSGEFVFSESEKLHEGAVDSLLFENDELRFFSSGADRRLLVTHARGRLEPEDRGRSNNHEGPVTAIVHAGDDRIITASSDKSCKSWARTGASKPQTQTGDLVAATHLAIATIHGRKILVVGCADTSLRLFLIKDNERIGDLLCRYNDLYSRAAEMLRSGDPAVRGEAMQELADCDDRRTAEMLAGQVTSDGDNKLRLTAAKLLSKSSHPQLPELLTPFLGHDDAPVRDLALKELAKLQPESQVELYQSAIDIGKADTGSLSVDELIKISKDTKRSEGERKQSQQVVATSALNSETVEIRNAAVLGLEKLFDKKSPRANLMTLDSSNADAKRKGLIRLVQRKLLDDETVAAGLRRAVEDGAPLVRQTAFYVSVLARPSLSKALREKDKEFERKLSEIERFEFDAKVSKKKTGKSG